LEAAPPSSYRRVTHKNEGSKCGRCSQYILAHKRSLGAQTGTRTRGASRLGSFSYSYEVT
jgi:hypothetical protein